MPTDVSEAVNTIIVDATKRHLMFNPDHISKYIKDHEESSVMPGVKWKTLPDPYTDDGARFWRLCIEEFKRIMDMVEDNPTHYPKNPLFVGGRARPEEQTQKDVWEYEFASMRSRIVMFTPHLSMTLVGIPKKKEWYAEIWDAVKRLFGAPDYVMFPPVDGGQVYKAISDALKDGTTVLIILGDDFTLVHKGRFFAWDGGNWEQFVPSILGEHSNWYSTSFAGLRTLPSGVFLTSLSGSIAMLWLGMQVLKQSEGNREVPGVFERETADENIKFMLGLRYGDDPEFPRLQGLKLSIDNATRTVPFKSGNWTAVKSKYSTQESLSWYNAYHGLMLDGRSLLEPFQAVQPEDYVNPGRLVQEVVLGGQQP